MNFKRPPSLVETGWLLSALLLAMLVMISITSLGALTRVNSRLDAAVERMPAVHELAEAQRLCRSTVTLLAITTFVSLAVAGTLSVLILKRQKTVAKHIEASAQACAVHFLALGRRMRSAAEWEEMDPSYAHDLASGLAGLDVLTESVRATFETMSGGGTHSPEEKDAAEYARQSAAWVALPSETRRELLAKAEEIKK